VFVYYIADFDPSGQHAAIVSEEKLRKHAKGVASVAAVMRQAQLEAIEEDVQPVFGWPGFEWRY
jgi:hypothetical protein